MCSLRLQDFFLRFRVARRLKLERECFRPWGFRFAMSSRSCGVEDRVSELLLVWAKHTRLHECRGGMGWKVSIYQWGCKHTRDSSSF